MVADAVAIIGGAERHRRRARPLSDHAQVHDRRPGDRGRRRARPCIQAAAASSASAIPPLLLAPGPVGRRQLPHVPRRDREAAEAADRLQHAGDATAWSSTPSVAEGRARRTARRSSSCSSTTRSTARSATRPASATCRTTTWRTAATTPQCSCEDKVHKRKVVDLGPIMLDAERCVLCSRCVRFEREVIGHEPLRVREPRRPHADRAPSRTGRSPHDYAGNLADVCPVGALLSHDFRFKMRVWFLKRARVGLPRLLDRLQRLRRRARRRGPPPAARAATPTSTSPGCATPAARSTARSALDDAASAARACAGAGGWDGLPLADALDRVAAALRDAGAASAFVATPQATNEDLFAFRPLADAAGGLLDFRVGDPQERVRERRDRRAPARGPQPEHAGLPRPGARPRRRRRRSSTACRAGEVKALVLQGPELLRAARGGRRARARCRSSAVMATHEGPELDARARRAAGGGLGRGRRHLHQLPAARAARCARRSCRRATRSRGGSSRRRSSSGSASRSAPTSAREVFAARSPRRRPTTRGARLPRARRRTGRALPLAEPAARTPARRRSRA